MENDFFEIKIKKEISVAPMREYIGEISVTTSITRETIYKGCLKKKVKGSKISIVVSQVATLFFPFPFFFFNHLSFFLFCSQQLLRPNVVP
jgi:hypothetical protein